MARIRKHAFETSSNQCICADGVLLCFCTILEVVTEVQTLFSVYETKEELLSWVNLPLQIEITQQQKLPTHDMNTPQWLKCIPW